MSVDDLQGREAIVVGGSGGIGAACAAALAASGCNVTVTAHSQAEVDAFAPEAATMGVAADVLDVRDEAAIRAFAASFKAADILVNAAGVIRRGEELETPVFEAVVDINLTGSLRTATAFHPLLRSSRFGGSVINLASMLSIFGGGHAPAYSASKGGVSQLTKSLAIAWAGDGIRVNAIAPGWIATPLTQRLRDDENRNRQVLDRTPMGRWGRPEEIGAVACFLCSSAASFITGTVIAVDGGYSIA